MGLFDNDSDRLRTPSHSGAHRGSSPARSSAGQGYFTRPSASSSSHRRARSPAASSFFGGLGGSSRGIFSGGNGGASYYKRRPRAGYVAMLMQRLQRMVKELWYYARRHPVKAFFAVVVPLLSAGGAIGGLMKQFGVRIPGMGAGSSYGSRSTSTYYGSRGYGGGGGLDGFGGGGGRGGGWMDNAGSLMQIAKAFM